MDALRGNFNDTINLLRKATAGRAFNAAKVCLVIIIPD
jgi:hypothetical protein